MALKQKGIASLLIMFLLLAGVSIGVYLVQQQQKTKSSASEIATSNLSSRALVFMIDEGHWNGITQQQDLVGLQTMLDSLKPFRQGFEVYVMLIPINKDPVKINKVLDKIVENDFPFVLEVMSSIAVGDLADFPINKVSDRNSLEILSTAQVSQYKQRYGAKFAGIRFHEVHSTDVNVGICRKESVPQWWCPARLSTLPESVVNLQKIENHIRAAKENNMFAMWVDLAWEKEGLFPEELRLKEQGLRDIIIRNKDTVVVLYANNVAGELGVSNGAAEARLAGWRGYIDTLIRYKPERSVVVDTGVKGFGMSIQAWNCKDYGPSVAWQCPFSKLKPWMDSAWKEGSKMIQLEPNWYFNHFPVGVLAETTLVQYQQNGGVPTSMKAPSFVYANRGMALPALRELAQAVGVTLNTPTPQVSAVVTTAVCTGSTPGMRVSWANPTGAKFHEIYRKSDTDPNWVSVRWTDGNLNPAASQFIDQSVQKGVRYAYAIKTYVAGFNQPAELAVHTNQSWPVALDCSTQVLSNVTAASQSCAQGKIPIAISWTNPAGAQWHQIERTQNGTTWSVSGFTDGNAPLVSTFTDLSPAASTWYAYRVSVAVSGRTALSSVVNSNWIASQTCQP